MPVIKKVDTISQVIITNNTQEILKRKLNDDYRVHFANYILFEDGIRDDIKKSYPEDNHILRKAKPGDVFVYDMIPDYQTIKITLEQNLNNLAKLKKQKEIYNLRKVWLFCYDIATEDAEKSEVNPSIVIYGDPNAADINKIIKEDRIILGVFIVVEYDSPKSIEDKTMESDKAEWVLLSPGDSRNIEEYERYLIDKEANNLSELFYLDFK